MSAGEIIAILAALGSILVAVVNGVNSARKSEVETLRALVVTVQAENERLRERVTELEDENKALRCELDAVREAQGKRKS